MGPARSLPGCMLAGALLAAAVHATDARAADTGTDACGEVVRIATHHATVTRYALVRPAGFAERKPRLAFVLLPGGDGHLDLDPAGCPRRLRGNSLVRSAPLLHAVGIATALVDAPSSHHGPEGLGGFRIDARHADDLGRVIADLRARTGAAVWLVGTSRGSISAINAASRLGAGAAPDGLVITSPVTAGNPRAKLAWVAQSVFDLPLESIRMPVLVVGHADDACARTPPSRMDAIVARTAGAREQVVVVSGGPGGTGLSSVEACEGRSPHGFVEQEAEVAAGIVRFVEGGRY